MRQLKYKAAWYGKDVMVIDRFYPSSKRCSACGSIHSGLALSERSWSCAGCGAEHDRDGNACKNMLAVGHTVSASGETVSPGAAWRVSVKEESP